MAAVGGSRRGKEGDARCLKRFFLPFLKDAYPANLLCKVLKHRSHLERRPKDLLAVDWRVTK